MPMPDADTQFRPWPDFDCPECGSAVWLDGFDDATTVRGEGDYRAVAHCGVCEFVAVSRHAGPDLDTDAPRPE